MTNRLALASWLALSLGARAAFADPTFQDGKQEELEDDATAEWAAAAEAGLVVTTGAAENINLTAGFKASRKKRDNKLSLEASGAYARSGTRVLVDRNANGTIDDEGEIGTVTTTTAETLAGKLRYDRFLADTNSLYLAALASRDLPAGKRLVFGGQIGYSRQLHKSEEVEAVAELGYDLSREALTAGDAVAIHSARLFAGVKTELNEGTHVDASLELLTNLNTEALPTGKDGAAFQDTRLNGRLGVTARFTERLSAQAAIEAKYDHRPGPLALKTLAPGFVPEAPMLDTLMKASLIYAF